MKHHSLLQRLCLFEARRFIVLVGIVALTHLVCQSLLLPYGNALRSLMAEGEVSRRGRVSISTVSQTSEKYAVPSNPSYFKVSELENDSDSEDEDIGNFVELINDDDIGNGDFRSKKAVGVHSVNVVVESIDDHFKDTENNSIAKMATNTRHGLSLEQVVKPRDELSSGDNIDGAITSALGKYRNVASHLLASSMVNSTLTSSINNTYLENSVLDKATSIHQTIPPSDPATVSNFTLMSTPLRKKLRCNMPPKSVMAIDEMNRLLTRHRRSSRSMRPRWSSVRDQEMLAAKVQIENARIVRNDQQLYAPLFRNISIFKRSYELMERTLKVYVYKDGKKPIFHQPTLKGLYASEGWFMKLMEGNRQFLVKDPQRAHLFYMPFSSRILGQTLYVRNSHNRTNLRQYLKQYSEQIAARYPFWNRTGGSDHFLVACHDWAPYETRHHMKQCIKALCNADVTVGFKIGRDVSLPETYVRSARNPLRDLGGKPASQRHILAFYAGSMHGYLRPILLQYWEKKDADMQILGPMPPGVASKMNYIQHMKSSKYCICPKGHEVNSPRVVEAIFYECVPVIISDNFVPPFFEVLNWDAFSVILAEKDIPNLKDILLAIPEAKYLEMQLAVRKAQQHFLWHAKPVKYDLFHMTLHSIWFNRVFHIKAR